MAFLYDVYKSVFGDSPRKIVVFGNVLLDRTAQLTDTALLDRFKLELESKGELGAEILTEITAEACKESGCSENVGGSALNTVRIMKHLGTDALFFGAVGDDENGKKLKELLLARGVETRLQTVSDTPTGQCICLVNESNTTMYANIGASAKFSRAFVQETMDSQPILRPVERKQIIYIEGFFIPQREEVCDYIVVKYIRDRRILALNLSAVYIVKENFEQISKLLCRAFFVFGNLNEYQALMELMNIKTLDVLAEALMSDEVQRVLVVTKGGDGVSVLTNYMQEVGTIAHETYHATKVDVVDTTGAGDAFVAGFLQSWIQKRSLSECIRIALEVAAAVVTQIGCNMPE